MELGFFTQPVHPLGRAYVETLAEDRAIFILADRLGFSEAFCGEHLTDEIENVPNSLMFLASLVDSTKTIKLGTAVLNLPFSHPVVVASNVAMLDNMLRGRLLLGVGPGIARADAEALDILDEDRNAMLDEAIDHVLALWQSKPPYRLSGKYWNISTERTLWPELGLGAVVKPYQTPHPPILGASGDARSKRVTSFGRRGWSLMSSDTLPACRLAEQWDSYTQGCVERGGKAIPQQWRVVRAIFVADNDKTAEAYGKTDPRSPYRQHFNHLLMKLARGRMLAHFKADPAVPDDEVTIDYVVENCVIAGSVNKLADAILAVREAAGPFGTLVYAGKNWTDAALSRHSMELMAEKVMPVVNTAIDRERAAG